MEESSPRESGYSDCGGLLFRGGERCRGPRLIVIFDETEQLLLIGKVSTKMKSNILCIFMLQPVVEPLVIAKVESLLLQFPLQIPVSLGNEERSQDALS